MKSGDYLFWGFMGGVGVGAAIVSGLFHHWRFLGVCLALIVLAVVGFWIETKTRKEKGEECPDE